MCSRCCCMSVSSAGCKEHDWMHHNVVCLSVCDAVHCGYAIHPMAKVFEQVNRKCPPRNTTVQLSTPNTDHKPSNSSSSSSSNSLPKNFQRRIKKNTHITWRTLCTHDAHADRDTVCILFLANQNFQRNLIGYLNSCTCCCKS